MTKERLAEIKRITDAATPGPLSVDDHGVYVFDKDMNMVAQMRGVGCGRTDEEMKANAELFSKSRTIIPELLAEVERMRRILLTCPACGTSGTFSEYERTGLATNCEPINKILKGE